MYLTCRFLILTINKNIFQVFTFRIMEKKFPRLFLGVPTEILTYGFVSTIIADFIDIFEINIQQTRQHQLNHKVL